MPSLEGQLPPRDCGSHPPTGKRRAFGKGPRPGRCAVVASHQSRVAAPSGTREGPVQRLGQTAPDMGGLRCDDRRVFIEVRQRSNLHQSLREVRPQVRFAGGMDPLGSGADRTSGSPGTVTAQVYSQVGRCQAEAHGPRAQLAVTDPRVGTVPARPRRGHRPRRSACRRPHRAGLTDRCPGPSVSSPRPVCGALRRQRSSALGARTRRG